MALKDVREGDVAQLLLKMPHLTHHLRLEEDDSGRSTLTCKSCGLSFTSVATATSHHCSFRCKRCGAQSESVEAIASHYAICLTRKSLQSAKTTKLSCKYCSILFKTDSDLQQHNKEHVSECLKQYAKLLKDRGLAETPDADPQPPVKRGRRRKVNDCTICGMVFQSPADHLHHRKLVHLDTLPHACRLCNDRFLYQHELEAHIVQHFLGSFECNFCDIKFGKKYPFLQHLEAKHSGDFLLKCEFCTYTTGNFQDYRKHRKEPHVEGDGTYSLSVCQHCQELVPEDEMEEHLTEHSNYLSTVSNADKRIIPVVRKPGRGKKKRVGIRKYSFCSECSVTFPNPASLSRHNHTHHPQKFNQKCETCGHRFKGTKSLRLHQEGHKSGSCWCPVCKLRFNQRLHIEHHFKMAHSDVKELDCEYCDDKFGSYTKYVYHCQISHADLLEDRVKLKCPQCDVMVSSRLLLKKHMAKDHDLRQKATKSECPVCKKFFVHIEAHMNLHMRAIQFPCQECGEVFFLRSSLIVHHKRHEQNAKVHKCPICSKSFISKSLLQSHQEQVHLNRRQFFCEICGRSYKNKSALTYHLKVHSGDRPYKCKECGVGFHRPSTLKTHMEGTHNLPYSYVYRKPQRKAGLGIPAPRLSNPGTSTEETIQDTSNMVKIYVSDEIIGEDAIEEVDIVKSMSDVDIVKDMSDVGKGSESDGPEESATCADMNVNSSEVITIVEDLGTLPELCGEEEVYIVYA